MLKIPAKLHSTFHVVQRAAASALRAPGLIAGQRLEKPQTLVGFVITDKVEPPYMVLADRFATNGPVIHLRDGFCRTGARAVLDEKGNIRQVINPDGTKNDGRTFLYPDEVEVTWLGDSRFVYRKGNWQMHVEVLADGSTIAQYPNGNKQVLSVNGKQTTYLTDGTVEEQFSDENWGRKIQRVVFPDKTTVIATMNSIGYEKITQHTDGSKVLEFAGRIIEFDCKHLPDKMSAVNDLESFVTIHEGSTFKITAAGAVRVCDEEGVHDFEISSRVSHAGFRGGTRHGDAAFLLRLQSGRRVELIYAAGRLIIVDKSGDNTPPVVLAEPTSHFEAVTDNRAENERRRSAHLHTVCFFDFAPRTQSSEDTVETYPSGAIAVRLKNGPVLEITADGSKRILYKE